MRQLAAMVGILVVLFIGAGAHVCIPANMNTLPDLVDKTLPAIVELRPGFAGWMGAGVLISDDGWLVTAKHVVEDQDVMIATMIDGVKYMSTTIIVGPNNDIAILKIDIEDAPHVGLSGVYPRLGESVYVVGHPLGVLNTVSSGIVSNIHRNGSSFGVDLIQVDAEITHGNSGGGLFDMQGRLVGIVVGGTVFYTGIEANLAVPIARGRELLEKYRRQEIAAGQN